MKGQQVTPMSDIVQLMTEGQRCEDKWGRDRGNGWLLSHPLKKLLLFQQFCLNNPDFLTAKCKLSQYYALANDDDCEMDIPEEDSECKEDSVSNNPSTNGTIAKQEEEKEEPESEVGNKNTRKGRQKVASKSQSNATKHAENSKEPESTTNRSQREQKRPRLQ